jgi:hypothetical protein
MRSEDGKHFENVVGITDRDPETGQEFEANVLNTENPLNAGDSISVGEKVFQYRGEDNLGCSIFTLPGQSVLSARCGK